MNADLEYALSLADDADALTMARYRSLDLWVETKSDRTPVTEADRAVEEALRARIERERPGETVAGEEFGIAEGDVRWWLDPIDGTKQYARGLPIWATLIAHERGGEVTVAVVSAPALSHRGPRAPAARSSTARRSAFPRSRNSRMHTFRRPACAGSPRSPHLRNVSPSRARTPTSGSTCSSPKDGWRLPATQR